MRPVPGIVIHIPQVFSQEITGSGTSAGRVDRVSHGMSRGGDGNRQWRRFSGKFFGSPTFHVGKINDELTCHYIA